MTKDITVVLPVFNAETYIKETLDSVFDQTFDGSIELLVINDGSEDESIQVINEYLSNNKKENIEVTVVDDGENLGPGSRRNYGLKTANGRAIQFLDSDDLLMPNALKFGYEKLFEDERNSFITYEWAFYYDESKETVYTSAEPFDRFSILNDRGCEMLLRSSSYFSVHKLYRKDFLLDNEIFYGEGYIYEDFEFFVKAAIRAQSVPMLSNILYKVRVHSNSITKTNVDSMKHYNSFLIAIKKAYDVMLNGVRNYETPYHVTKYFLGRAIIYSDRRLPNDKKLKEKFLRETLDIINEYYPNLEVPRSLAPYYNVIFNSDIIRERDVKGLLKIEEERKNGRINYYNFRQKKKLAKKQERKLRLSKWKSKIENNYYINPLVYNTRKFVHKQRNNKKRQQQLELQNMGLKDTIIMLGFDYKYTGNSRYLFEFLKTKYTGSKLKFVTNDMRVPNEYRIEPRSNDFFHAFYSSKVVIAESWIPKAFVKVEGQKWIQLWHGTPLKRLLFDTHESNLLRLNPHHRVRMKSDIERWDYLLSDSEAGADKLHSAFDIPREKILNYGYPRNEFLVKNTNNEDLKKKIRLRYNLPLDKKIILYVPTWRDYNYKQVGKKLDFSYQLNLHYLLNQLGDDYVVIDKGHSMDTRKNRPIVPGIIVSNNSMETQDLILVSDIIVTDYSSIFYDGIHIDKPFYILAKDQNKFERARGTYEDFMEDIKMVTFSNDYDILYAIKHNRYKKIEIQDKYRNKNILNSSEHLYELISELL